MLGVDDAEVEKSVAKLVRSQLDGRKGAGRRRNSAYPRSSLSIFWSTARSMS